MSYTRFCATEDYFIYSLVTYVDRQFNGTIQSITRSACANSSSPVIVEGLCIFGCHDGRVYALRTADGSLAWRFMAAPYERKVIVNSRLESSWPVYGVVMRQGLLCASAGLHPELGGGIYVYGLQPKTGNIAWKRTLTKSHALIKGTDRIQSRIVPISALNDTLKTDGNTLSLPAGRDRIFKFSPTESDDEIGLKLHTNPPKKR